MVPRSRMSCRARARRAEFTPDAVRSPRAAEQRRVVPVLLHQALHPLNSWVNSPSMSRWRARVWLRVAAGRRAGHRGVDVGEALQQALHGGALRADAVSVQKGVAHPGAHRRAARQLRERAELHVDLALELSRLRGERGEASVASWGLEGRARARFMRGGDGPGPRGDIQRIRSEIAQEWGRGRGRDAHLLAQLLPRAGRHRKPTHSSTPAGVCILSCARARDGVARSGRGGVPKIPSETDSRPCCRETRTAGSAPKCSKSSWCRDAIRSRAALRTRAGVAFGASPATHALRLLARGSVIALDSLRPRVVPRARLRQSLRAEPSRPPRSRVVSPPTRALLPRAPFARRTRPHPSSPASPPSP